MAVRERLEPQIARLEEKLQGDRSSHPPLALTPGWFQQRLLDWATTDPDFRVKLLRFVDVLPTLRSSSPITSDSTSEAPLPGSFRPLPAWPRSPFSAQSSPRS